MNCLLRKNFNHFDNLILSTMVPLMIAIILLLAALLLRRFEERQRRSGSQTARRSVECFAAFLLLTFIVLPSASNTILRTFYCTEIATGDEWLVADYSIRCGTSQHRLHLVFCYIMIFIYPFGIPFLYMMLLYRHRKKINPKTDHYNALLLREKEEDSLYHIAFLYRYYRPAAWYFEVVDSLRRIILCAGLIGIKSLPQRACVGTGLSFLSFVLFRVRETFLR